MDFVYDALADGRQFRVLTVVDQWSRESPLLEVATAMSGRTVAEALDRVLGGRGVIPRSITVDHGTEFMSRALEDWAFYRASSSISHGPANRRKTPSSNRLTGGSATSV